MRRLPASDTRALPKDRTRPVSDAIPLTRATTGDDRGSRPTELAADDRPRVIVPLEKRLSQPAPAPSLQDRLSQPVPPAVPARVDIASAPSLEERLSSGPVPPRAYPRLLGGGFSQPEIRRFQANGPRGNILPHLIISIT